MNGVPHRLPLTSASTAADFGNRATDQVPYDRAQRLKKLSEYGDKVLAMADPLVASLGAVELDLHAQLCYIRDDMEELRRTVRDPDQRARILLPLSDQYYKLAKQLEATFRLRDGVQKGGRKVLRPPANVRPAATNADRRDGKS